ncbi:helix-turn-helix domain-containing protein [Microbacterium sp. Bi128]|uniref:helix-turn-helix domain-containing protein n=1 Tax=Microbacterium sp. Bi128 TaxID=2821115 RepID=UPI0035AB6A3B
MLWTLEDVAAMCGISRSTAYRHLKENSWPHCRIGTELRFSVADIEAIQALNVVVPTALVERRRTPRVGIRANRHPPDNIVATF